MFLQARWDDIFINYNMNRHHKIFKTSSDLSTLTALLNHIIFSPSQTDKTVPLNIMFIGQLYFNVCPSYSCFQNEILFGCSVEQRSKFFSVSQNLCNICFVKKPFTPLKVHLHEIFDFRFFFIKSMLLVLWFLSYIIF